MYGAIELYQKATKGGIKPLLGCEVYIAKVDAREALEEERQMVQPPRCWRARTRLQEPRQADERIRRRLPLQAADRHGSAAPALAGISCSRGASRVRSTSHARQGPRPRTGPPTCATSSARTTSGSSPANGLTIQADANENPCDARAHGHPRRDQRHPLPARRGLPRPGRAPVHQHGREEGGPEPLLRDRQPLLPRRARRGHMFRDLPVGHRDHGRRGADQRRADLRQVPRRVRLGHGGVAGRLRPPRRASPRALRNGQPQAATASSERSPSSATSGSCRTS